MAKLGMIKGHAEVPCAPPVRLTVSDVVIPEGAAPDDLGPEGADADGDIHLPEADLPEVDAEDAEALLEDMPDYADLLEADLLEADLLDDEALERTIDVGEVDTDRTSAIDVGLTLDLNGPDSVEELAQVLDLDVGSLLTSLPHEGVQGDSDAPGRDLGPADGPFAVGALRDILLPEGAALGELGGLDEEAWDDERFPAFEAPPGVLRPLLDDDADNIPDDDAQ